MLKPIVINLSATNIESNIPRHPVSRKKVLHLQSKMNIHLKNITADGFTVAEDIFNTDEINTILHKIAEVGTNKPTFRKSEELFAIRQFLIEVPAVHPDIFNDRLKAIINDLFGFDYFIVKSIYFDKPETSNWFVAWHQDLTLSVEEKAELTGYGPWVKKQDYFSVQPPLNMLEDNFTIRIHLTDTDAGNGALNVVPGSHLKGVYRPENINWAAETKVVCSVKAGGVMIMRPLLLHASNRTINNKPRKVIHIEFSRCQLPAALKWAEKEKLP